MKTKRDSRYQKLSIDDIDIQMQMQIYNDLYAITRNTSLTNLKKMYKSPFTDEKTPSFHLYRSNNKLMFKCFSSGKGGDIIAFVKLVYNISYSDAVNLIKKDYLHVEVPNFRKQITLPQLKTVIPVEECKDISYEVLGSTDSLKVIENWFKSINYPVDPFQITTGFDMIPITSATIITYADLAGINISNIKTNSYSQPAFAFKYDSMGVHYNRCKVYTPGKKPKMFGNTTAEDIFYDKTKKDKLFYNKDAIIMICAGHKDTIIMNQIMKETNFLPICANSENVILGVDELYNVIGYTPNRSDVCVLMDNDDAGKMADIKYYSLGYNVFGNQFWNELAPKPTYAGVKDIGDYFMFDNRYIIDEKENLIRYRINQLKPFDHQL